jgi:cell division protein FtsW (lipid II flippase)
MDSFWKQLAIATNWPVLVAVGVLTGMGIISIWAHDPGDGQKQIVFACIGLVLLIAIQTVNYQVLARFAWAFYLVSLMPVFYTVMGSVIGSGVRGDQPLPFVRNVGGAYAWLIFGPVSLQPAELVKISFVMVMAHYLRYRNNYRNFWGLVPPFMLAVVPLLLILKQPDLGTALTFIPALFAMIFVAGAKLQHLFAIVGMGVALAPIAWLSGTDIPVFRHLPAIVKPYQRERVYALFRSDEGTKDINYQTELGEIAMGTGGLTGKGLGEIPVGKRVPEAHNDMIFAIIGEQFGFIGSLVVLVAYIVLFAAGVEISAATREPFGKIAAVGIIAFLAGQAFINLLVVTRLMPVTGITLPFVSYGGSSLLSSFIAVGLLLNIGQHRPLIMARDSFEF